MFREGKVLVTGGLGFMGSDFIRYLLQETRFSGTVVNLDLVTYAANKENLKEIEKDPRYVFVHGDICDEKLIERLFSKYHFELIVHFAAETHVDRSIDQPKTFIETNIIGTYTLLESLRRHPKTRFHLISTDEVYGDLPEHGEFTEESPYAPSSPYAASKAAADHLAEAYARTYDVSITISHASNNYGPHQHPEKLIPKIIDACQKGEDITVYGSGKQVRDWLHVRDHSRGIFMILSYGKNGEVYNVGGSNERTNLEVIHHIITQYAKTQKKDPEIFRNRIIHVADRPGHDFRYAMDITKMRREIGWEPEIDFDEGLKEAIQERLKK
jgi:dTDP-glucose 4,6-dehydratase